MAAEGYGTLVNSLLSAMTYIGASTIFIHSIKSFIPSKLIDYFNYYLELITRYFTRTLTMVIEEYSGLVSNEIFEAAEIYVGSKMSPLTRRIKVSKPRKEEKLSITMDDSEEVFDVFNGVKFEWILIRAKKDESEGNNTIIINNTRNSQSSPSTQKYFCLSFHKKHIQMVYDDYLPYILKEYKSIQEKKKTLKIFTIDLMGFWKGGDVWSPIKLDHPANFDKLAMDSNLKKTIIDDLDRFVRRKDFYRRVGKAWKRGYLLYGPPGTGKSSLIAAMANYLNFDIYDLELNEIPGNSYLRSILLATANRSILVVEDIDCSVDFESREGKKKVKNDEDDEDKVTLSGFLNFIDGLWSSAGDERIIVFTTNHKEKLDPALLRPGRMDMHILMSYCTPCGFKTLVSNYLEIKEHHLFEKIEGIIEEAEVTPAEVAEQLMKGDDPDIVLQELIEFLQQKKIEHDEAKEKATREAEEAEKRAKEKKEKKNKKKQDQDEDKKKQDQDDEKQDQDDDKKKQDQDDDSNSDEETSSDSDSSSGSSSSSSSSSNSDSSDVDE